MKITLSKFGTMLTSRQSGREAFAAFQPMLGTVGEAETIEVNFDDITTFSPSWGDEFLRPLQEAYGRRLFLKPSVNPSVQVTLEILEEAHKMKFQKSPA